SKTTAECIRSTGSLCVLTLASGQKYHEKLPSWVPDFGLSDNYFSTVSDERYQLYDSSGRSTAVVTLEDNLILQVEGLIVGTIDLIGRPMLWDHDQSRVEVIRDWWE